MFLLQIADEGFGFPTRELLKPQDSSREVGFSVSFGHRSKPEQCWRGGPFEAQSLSCLVRSSGLFRVCGQRDT